MTTGSIGDTEVGGAAGGTAIGAGLPGGGSTGIGAATAVVGALFGGCPAPDGARSTAATAVLQAGDSRAMCDLRHCSAALPPGVTPAQFAAKSVRQDCRIASVWACVGCRGAGISVGIGCRAGAGISVAGAGGGTGGAGGFGTATAAGGGLGGAAGMIALTAVRQGGDSLPTFCLRQSSASFPPGCTPEQFAMKSWRQDLRIASV